MVDKWALTNFFTENIQNLGMEPYLDLEAHINVLNPGLYEPEGGPKLDTLDMIKIRIAQLKFRRKVLLKGVQFRMRVSESQGEWKYEELFKRTGLYSW